MIIRTAKKISSVRIFRYIVAGGTGAAVDLGALFIFTHFFHWWYLLSSVVAFILAFFVSFTLQKFVTFNERAKHRIPRQIVFYFCVAVSNLGINTLLMFVGVDVFKFHYLATQFVINGLIACYSFFVYKYFIFHEHGSSLTQKITRKNLEPFLEKYATNKRVLDIGSGGSSYDRFFPNRVSIDIDPARKPDIVADAHSLPFTNGEFEMVLSTEMLEHVKDPFKVEREIRRVMAPDGLLILSTRFVFPLHDIPHDYWRYTKYGLKELFKEWEILDIVEETENFSAVGALIQRICFQSELFGGKITKGILFLIAKFFSELDWLTRKEFGDIKRSRSEKSLMPTGYYIVCRKKP